MSMSAVRVPSTSSFARLFRDLLRSHPGTAGAYAALKYDLAAQFSTPEQRHDYVRAKAPFVWEAMQLADEWAGEVAWEAGPSDAWALTRWTRRRAVARPPGLGSVRTLGLSVYPKTQTYVPGRS